MSLPNEVSSTKLQFLNLRRFGSTDAFVTEHDSINYGQLADRVDSFHEYFCARDLVFCLCRNSLGSIIGYLAALRHQVIPVLLSAQYSCEHLSVLISAYHPKFIWIPQNLVTPEAYQDAGVSLYDYRLLIAKILPRYPVAAELAVLMTTSGSTGNPVFIRQSYQNIAENTESICKSLSITNIDRPMTTLPMNYTYGLSVLHTHLSRGCTIVLNDASMMEKSFWSLVRDQEVSSFAGVPYTYEMLDRLRFERMLLPTLKVMTQAGGALRKDLVTKFAELCAERGMRFYSMYGQVEATARMSCLPHEFAISKAGSIGTAIPGGRFWLEDEQGLVIDSADVAGELCYSGKNVSMGIASSYADLNLPDVRQGILHTGDMAYRDSDGFYFIVGRKKRFVKLFGHRMNLADIEDFLGRKEIECACVGDDQCIRIFTTIDVSAHRKIQQDLAESLGIHASAFTIISIDQIPRNESGKILYPQLQKRVD